MDVSNMRDGDFAGLAAFQRKYGFVAVKRTGIVKSIVMVSAETDSAVEVEVAALNQGIVFLKADCDFRDRADRACFYYSLDGKSWKSIGKPLQMAYTLPHFMGYRFGLFNFATKSAGGHVDFNYFRVSDKLTEGN
jgi:beta-xylosidase